MKYRYVNIEFGIDLSGKYSYHGFIMGVISNVSSLYELHYSFSARCIVYIYSIGFS
jgi:hypothetical protein